MRLKSIVVCCITAALLLILGSCRQRSKDTDDLFGHEVPQNFLFKKDLTYLDTTGQLTAPDRAKIEGEFREAQKAFGVPHTLLWCLLFQESRFDSLKNASRGKGARGLGQFTHHALKEINQDTDHFDDRTSDILKAKLNPRKMPLTFDLGFEITPEILDRRNRSFPTPSKKSYFHTNTAVFASAAYLNNRYQQIKKALDRQQVLYDPQVIWLYAAAAYNKGARTVFNLLSHQRSFGGESAIAELLLDPKLSYALLTHHELLDYSLRDLWDTETREKYIQELVKSMELILSCAIPARIL